MPDATTQIAVQEPAEHPERRFRPISDRRLDAAARELNLLNISAKRLVNVATVGRFVREIGLLQYGNGRLIGSAVAMQEGVLLCGELARRDGPDEVRQAYLELQLRFLKALDENMVMQIEANKHARKPAAEASSMPQGKPFLPGAQISPIQINVHGGTVEQPREQPCKTSPT